MLNLECLFGSDSLELCEKTFKSSIFTRSSFQIIVSNCLKELGFDLFEEYLDKNTGYTIDILLVNKNGAPHLAVEVDGPTHFIRLSNGLFRPNGATCLKRRLLASSGLKTLSVPFFDWKSLRNKTQQETYLRKLLNT